MRITEFDTAPDPREVLLEVCSAPRWADAVAAGRPYGSLPALQAVARAELSPADLDAALAGHPRIGDRVEGRSGREQAAVAAAPDEVRAALAAGNRAYEERFGRVYLVCASGRSAPDLLATLRARLDNDPETERAVALEELAAINALRLAALFAPTPSPSTPSPSTLSTHVLDAALGRPAAGVPVRLERGGEVLAQGTTDADGRVRDLGALGPGTHRLVFDTGAYFTATGQHGFYPEVAVAFTAGDGHHHVPLLLSPFHYSTYRGS